jgi:hypothetical protein
MRSALLAGTNSNAAPKEVSVQSSVSIKDRLPSPANMDRASDCHRRRADALTDLLRC